MSGGEYTQAYFDLQLYYTNMLWSYLNQKIDICAFDRELSLDEMRFIPAQEPDSVYQANTSGGCAYVFLRSNVHIERITREELDMLCALYKA